jgi:hypothetical protein
VTLVPKAPGNLVAQLLAHTGQRDALDDRSQKALHDQLLGFRARDAPRLEVEELFLI